MLEYYKTYGTVTKKIDAPELGCWINVVAPSEEEKNFLTEKIGVLPEFIKSSLDPEESSHIDYDEDYNQRLVIIDYPSADENAEGYDKNMLQYTTLPLGIIIMKGLQMLGLEKSLVYFSTSLKTDEITLNKIMRGKIIKLYDEDQDLLEDVLIEIKQAIEMCNIYSNILSGTMDAFASVISNNLNIVMKVLTVITIVMSIPNIIFSFYGMNVTGLPIAHWWFPTLIAIIACIIATIIFIKKDMFH